MRPPPAPLRRASLVLLLVTSTVLSGVARSPQARAAEALNADDQAAALALEAKIPDLLWYGQIFEADYGTTARIPGDVVSVNHFGDSALWTGTYLAAESYRYAVAKRHVAAGDDAGGAWTAQRDEAKSRIDRMVAKYHLLINISKNWNYHLKPSLDPPSFGGGVFHGEPGYLMRACIPTDAPSWQTWGVPRGPRVFGPLKWDDGMTYWCEDGTSRDAYAGAVFGLLTAFDLVGPDDWTIKTTIRDDIMAMTLFAAKYLWTTPRPHGNISLPPEDLEGVSPVDIFGHDFENFISPLFVYVPISRLNLAQAARHVVGNPLSARARPFTAIWAEELATQLPILAAEMEIDSFQPNDGYYKFNLNHLMGFDVIGLETFGPTRLAFKQAFGVMDTTTRDDGNAHFEALTYLLTGEPARRDLAIRHLREWRVWKDRLEQGRNPLNSQRCGSGLTCVPEDRLDWYIGGQTITVFPGTSGNRAATPIDVADRPDADFLWQRPPTRLDGAESPVHRTAGVDYLLPYWMLRYAAEVAQPRLEPFPAWPGPSHR